MARLQTGCSPSPRSSTPMRASLTALAAVACFGAILVAQQPGETPAQQRSPSGLGRPPSRAELQAWDISIGPEGAELPQGSGTVTQGTLVFTQRGCSDCHGPTGKEGPAPVLIGGKMTPSTTYFPVQYWPFAPSI